MSKFKHNAISEKLYDLSMISGQDAETGDVQEYGGWYALFTLSPEEMVEYGADAPAYILAEDSQGFVEAVEYSSHEAAQAKFDEIDADYCQLTGEDC